MNFKYGHWGTTYSGRMYVIKDVFYNTPKVIKTLENMKKMVLKKRN